MPALAKGLVHSSGHRYHARQVFVSYSDTDGRCNMLTVELGMAPPTGRPIIAGLDVGRLLTVSRNTHGSCLSYQGTEYPLNC